MISSWNSAQVQSFLNSGHCHVNSFICISLLRLELVKSKSASEKTTPTKSYPLTNSIVSGMNFVGRVAKGVKDFYNEINPATLTGRWSKCQNSFTFLSPFFSTLVWFDFIQVLNLLLISHTFTRLICHHILQH